MKSITLTGQSLSHEQVVAVAYGASVALDEAQLIGVADTADFLAEQVKQQQPLYGVSTGFGSNADKLLGAHHIRASQNNDGTLLEELQRNLIITHAVCVGEPFACRCGTRDDGDPHQYPDARAFRHPGADPAGLGRHVECRHCSGCAEARLCRCQRRSGAVIASGHRFAGRR